MDDWRVSRRRRDKSELRTERITDLAAGDRERITQLEIRVDALEKAMKMKADNDAVAVPRAFGDLVNRVAQLAEAVDNLTNGEGDSATVNLEVNELGATELAQEVADLAAVSMRLFSEVRSETDALRRRVNQLDIQSADLIGGLREFARKERRHA